MRLKEKVALVTGSSRGVGRSIAIGYAKDGAKVVVNYTSNEKAALEVVDKIKSLGSNAIAVKADVARKEDVETLVKASNEAFTSVSTSSFRADRHPGEQRGIYQTQHDAQDERG